MWSDVDPNGLIYDGATGELLTSRIWISLYKEGGFGMNLYNTVAIEPFVYSADIMHMNHTTMGGVLDFVNQTIPLRECTRLNTVDSGTTKDMAVIDSKWSWQDSEGPYLFGSTSGWDEIKHVDLSLIHI